MRQPPCQGTLSPLSLTVNAPQVKAASKLATLASCDDQHTCPHGPSSTLSLLSASPESTHPLRGRTFATLDSIEPGDAHTGANLATHAPQNESESHPTAGLLSPLSRFFCSWGYLKRPSEISTLATLEQRHMGMPMSMYVSREAQKWAPYVHTRHARS